MVEMAVAFEEMGRALTPGAYLSTVALAGSLIEKACTAEYRAGRLRAICEGELKATVALLEESANWDLDEVRLPAVETDRTDGSIKLTGKKLFVSDAEVSDCIITPVRRGSEIVLAFVDRSAVGLTVKAMPGLDATRLLYEVEFNDVVLKDVGHRSDFEAVRAAICGTLGP